MAWHIVSLETTSSAAITGAVTKGTSEAAVQAMNLVFNVFSCEYVQARKLITSQQDRVRYCLPDRSVIALGAEVTQADSLSVISARAW